MYSVKHLMVIRTVKISSSNITNQHTCTNLCTLPIAVLFFFFFFFFFLFKVPFFLPFCLISLTVLNEPTNKFSDNDF